MAIENNVAGTPGRSQFHSDISNQIFADVKPRTRTADAKAAAEKAATEAAAAKKTEANADEKSTAKTDEVTTTEPSAKAKIDTKSINDILDNMRKSVSKLSDTDADEKSVQAELAAYQKELQNFVGGYNDALNYAKSSSDNAAITNAASMVTRTASNQDALGKLGIKVNDNNSLESISALQANKESLAAMKDLFAGKYSYASKTLESVQGVFES
jgi:hypothetical protein